MRGSALHGGGSDCQRASGSEPRERSNPANRPATERVGGLGAKPQVNKMKSNRQISRAARRLFRLCLVDGVLDETRTKQVAQRIALSGRRGSQTVLKRFLRL